MNYLNILARVIHWILPCPHCERNNRLLEDYKEIAKKDLEIIAKLRDDLVGTQVFTKQMHNIYADLLAEAGGEITYDDVIQKMNFNN